MHKKYISAILVLVAGATFLPASGNLQGQRFTLSPTIGLQTGYRFGNLVPLPQTADVPETEVLLESKGVSVGLGFGYRLSPHIEIQSEFAYESPEIINDVGIGLAGTPLGKVKVSDAKLYAYSGRILYLVLAGRISPYIAAGLGAVTLDIDEFGSRTKLLLHFGLGLDFELSKRIYAVLEIRDCVHFFRFDEDFEFLYIQIYTPDFKTMEHSLGARIGLKFGF